jgi:predicted ATP-dependent serine protease
MELSIDSYICPDCASISLYKGLCRECTVYGSAGEIVTPVRRQKQGVHVHDENCDHDHDHDHHTNEGLRISLDDFVNARRPKPSKKQIESMNALLEDAQNFLEEE